MSIRNSVLIGGVPTVPNLGVIEDLEGMSPFAVCREIQNILNITTEYFGKSRVIRPPVFCWADA